MTARAVLDAPGMEPKLEALAQRLHCAPHVARGHVGACLDEIVATQGSLATRAWDGLFWPMHARAWTVEVDRAALTRLRELNREQSLVFLPSHRSYLDPIILAGVLRREGLPRNFVLGGNNMAFWPFGALGRRAGIVFIRRSFRDDDAYKLALGEYIKHLVARGCNLEWYLEGGRSRTGKLRPPRYGLLQYLAQAVQTGGRDVLLVPVSITFEQLAELGAMAAEEGGARKSREGLKWFAGYIRDQQVAQGPVYLRFGEPFSLRQAFGPDASNAVSRRAVQKVAFNVCQRINRATPVTAPALITLALLGVRDRALAVKEIGDLVRPLIDYAKRRGLPTGQLDSLAQPAGVAQVLDRLLRRGVVTRYADGLAPVYGIAPGQHRVAAFYRNSAVHWFIERAILELALLKTDVTGTHSGAYVAWTTALALRDLLKFEFFFTDKLAFRDQMQAEAALLDPHWRDTWRLPDHRRTVLARADFLVAHRALSAFVEAYFVVADRLAAQSPDRAIEPDSFFSECATVGRQYLLQKRLYNPECLSRELFGNALDLAANRGLRGPGAEDLAGRRRAFAAELWAVVQAVAEIERLDQGRAAASTGRNHAPAPTQGLDGGTHTARSRPVEAAGSGPELAGAAP